MLTSYALPVGPLSNAKRRVYGEIRCQHVGPIVHADRDNAKVGQFSLQHCRGFSQIALGRARDHIRVAVAINTADGIVKPPRQPDQDHLLAEYPVEVTIECRLDQDVTRFSAQPARIGELFVSPTQQDRCISLSVLVPRHTLRPQAFEAHAGSAGHGGKSHRFTLPARPRSNQASPSLRFENRPAHAVALNDHFTLIVCGRSLPRYGSRHPTDGGNAETSSERIGALEHAFRTSWSSSLLLRFLSFRWNHLEMHQTRQLMKTPLTLLLPIIAIDRRKSTHLQRQVYEPCRTAIADGTLRAPQRVPWPCLPHNRCAPRRARLKLPSRPESDRKESASSSPPL